MGGGFAIIARLRVAMARFAPHRSPAVTASPSGEAIIQYKENTMKTQPLKGMRDLLPREQIAHTL